MTHRMSVQTQLAEKITTSRIYKKVIKCYYRVYNQIALDVCRYNNPIYKLMTNIEQTATGIN